MMAIVIVDKTAILYVDVAVEPISFKKRKRESAQRQTLTDCVSLGRKRVYE